MVRFSFIVFLFLLVIFISPQNSFAATKTVRITSLPEKKQKSIRVKWKQKNHRILHDSVCYNHPGGDITYRNCRDRAKDLFEERCEKYKKLFQTTRYPYDQEYLDKKEMYCTSAATFWP